MPFRDTSGTWFKQAGFMSIWTKSGWVVSLHRSLLRSANGLRMSSCGHQIHCVRFVYTLHLSFGFTRASCGCAGINRNECHCRFINELTRQPIRYSFTIQCQIVQDLFRKEPCSLLTFCQKKQKNKMQDKDFIASEWVHRGGHLRSSSLIWRKLLLMSMCIS